MKEIDEAIKALKGIKTEDEDTMRELVAIEMNLKKANDNDADLVNRHGKLVQDYRELLVNHPANIKDAKEEEDNPPPPSPKKVTFEEALKTTLEKRNKK